MHPDLELFNRFKDLAFELRNTAAVVQNNHDQLIEDGQIGADDVRRNIAQFSERCEDHVSELQALQRATVRRLDAVLIALENKSNFGDLSSKFMVKTFIVQDDLIAQETTDLIGQIHRKVVKAQDDQMRKALISLGWTPPGGNLMKSIQLPPPKDLPSTKPVMRMMRPVACKHCPSTHHPADPECVDIRAAPKEERLATAFPCAWDPDYYCRGYCLYMDISNADLATKGEA